MNLCLRISSAPCSLGRSHFTRNLRTPKFTKRRYATQNTPPANKGPNLRLSQTLDQRQRASADVGPFRLGVTPAYGAQQTAPKWKDLSPKAKVFRSTANTTNLVVILVGAGLCCVLIYSLTSELFSPNSPTVLYGDACDRIKVSSRVKKYLNGSLTFHTEPFSSLRPRHRNRQVASTIVFDSVGREHMLLNFFVSAAPISRDDQSYLDKLNSWWYSFSDMTTQDCAAWIRTKSNKAWDSGKSAVRFVSGTPERIDSGPNPSLSVLDSREDSQPATTKAGSWFTGLFGSLRVATGGGGNFHVTHPELDGRTFTEGQISVDLMRNSDGYFVYRYLVVDLPNSTRNDHVRIYVERAPGVTDRDVYTR